MTRASDLSQRLRLGASGFAIVGGAGLLGGLDQHAWAVITFNAVIVAALLGSAAVDIVRAFNSPENLDRKGGPYDHLHERKSSKSLR